MKSNELIKGTTGMLILKLLSASPMHGYEIIKKMDQQSKGVFTLQEGTLYPVLHALESAGLLEAVWEGDTGRKRKVYSITQKGVKELQSKHKEWNTVREAVDFVMGGNKLCMNNQ